MQVPFLDLTRQNQAVKAEAMAALAAAIDGSAFIGGRQVQEFEQNFARFCRAAHGVAVNSGTDALRLAMLACGVAPGEEVITVPFTFIATSEVISQTGAKIVFVDIEPDTYTMDPAAAAAAVTPNTRGVIPVHLYGQPADLAPLLETARRHGQWIIEDACQAHGAELGGQGVGAIGDAGTFSFYPTKNLGAMGDAGFVTSQDEAIAQKVLALRNHGQSARYAHEFEGFNARLDAIQAAILDAKLRHLPAWNAERRHWAELYRQGLAGVGDLVLPALRPAATHVYHLFTVRSERRDALRAYLTERGIGTAVHYPTPLHLQPAYRHLGYKPGDLPVSEACARTVMSLPLYQGITESEVQYVIETIRAFF